MKHQSTDLRSIFNRDSHLRKLIERAGDFQSLTDQVRNLLPPSLAEHLSAAVGRDHALVLITDSSAWATRFRFSAPGLKASLKEFAEIQVRVVPDSATYSSKDSGHHKAHLSRTAAEQIRIMAATISDPDLRKTLERIATHADSDTY